jgi:plastocyanin
MPALQPVTQTITQEKMQFSPVVSVVPVGSRLKFANLDRWDHHVRGGPAGLVATGAYGFEFRLAGREPGQTPPSSEVTMDKGGPVQLGCHLHGSMRGFVYVTPSPWAAKTEASGVATLAQVPEGAMQLRVWHPDQLLDQASITVQVQAVTAINVPTQVQPRKPRRAAAEPSSTY